VAKCRPLIFDADGWHPETPQMRLLNLQRRPFFDGSAAVPFTFYIPSGFVPGDVDGGHRRLPSQFIGGEAEGLDRIFKFLAEVLSMFFQD
jgi:hypothetical protein